VRQKPSVTSPNSRGAAGALGPIRSNSHSKGGEAMEAYCVKCKAKREMNNPTQVTMKNGKPATQGICPVCGTKMFKIGASKPSCSCS